MVDGEKIWFSVGKFLSYFFLQICFFGGGVNEFFPDPPIVSFFEKSKKKPEQGSHTISNDCFTI